MTNDSSTLTGIVYGLHCEPFPATGAHLTTGTYSIMSGTGRFKTLNGATGTISFDGRADGSAVITISGTYLYGRGR